MPQLDVQEQIAEVGAVIARTLREAAAGKMLKTPYSYIFTHEGRRYSLMLLEVEDDGEREGA